MTHDCFSKTLIAVAAFGILFGSAPAPVCADDLSKTVEIRLPAVPTSANAGSAGSASSPGLPGSANKASAPVEHRIGRIEIQGNWLIFAETIKRVIRTKEGAVYDREQIVKDLRSIYNLGYFESEGVKAVPKLHGDTVDIVFCVSEAPVLQGVSFRGNPQIIDFELKSVIGDFVGWPLAEWRLNAAIQKIKDLCIARGVEHCSVISTKAKYLSTPEFYAFTARDRVKSSASYHQSPVLMKTVMSSPLRSADDYTLVLQISGQPNSSMKQASSVGRSITLPADGRFFLRGSNMEIRPIQFKTNPWLKNH